LNYIDSEKVPLIKARIARELSENEIFLCEILMENVLDDLEPNELAAVLSVI
jgi:superfamily II RNA helicase